MNTVLLLSKWGKQLGKKLMKPITKKKPEVECNRYKIVKGDMVEVIQGPQTGQRGKVTTVIRRMNRVIIDGVNMVRNRALEYTCSHNEFCFPSLSRLSLPLCLLPQRPRIVKSNLTGMPGRKIIKPCSIHYSNIMLVDPTDK
jgi:ribosomal protein L24